MEPLTFQGQAVIAPIVGGFVPFTIPRVPIQVTALLALLALSPLFLISRQPPSRSRTRG